MASGWTPVRDELRTTLEGADLGLRRVKRGVGDLAGLVESGAGRALFDNGYFISITSLNLGPYMQVLSTERTLGFEIYTGANVGSDYGESLDALIERCELIAQKLHNCNANVPSAKIVTLSGDVTFNHMLDEAAQVFAIMPYRVVYRMP
tara:strand:+ start:3167 stop:3613 length:447 start_codon:yes stop_codon:yes gene_type:complete